MENILESNLARPGVEELAFASDPHLFRDRMDGLANQRQRIFAVAALLSGVVALLPISPLWAVGGFGVSSLILLSSYGARGEKEYQAPDSYVTLWSEWQNERKLKAEVDRLQQQATKLKNAPVTREVSWFSRWVFSSTLPIEESMVARDLSWQNLCDDLAGAAAEVGKLSVQSDRARHFRSHLLYVIRESVEALSRVADDVTDRSSCMALVERKFQIAHLLSWMKERDPRMVHGYPNLSDGVGYSPLVGSKMVQCYTTRLIR